MGKSDSRRKFLINTATIGAGMMLPVKTLASLSHIQVQSEPDFIIVGSGAGGGPLAARLARRGYYVVLLEAGRDHKDPNQPELAAVEQRIPAYQGVSTEIDQWSWNYYVRHSDMAPGKRSTSFRFDDRKDSKFVKEENGILYPRASALGGCTIHNAMITMIADPQDWDNIKNLTGDASWNSKEMQRLFIDRIRNKRYGSGIFSGNRYESRNYLRGSEGNWLSNERPNPGLVAFDENLRDTTFGSVFRSLWNGTKLLSDPNGSPYSGRKEGAYFTPMASRDGLRSSPREWLLETQNSSKGRLEIRTGHFVTNLLFGDKSPDGKHKVIGVEGLHHELNLYEASPEYKSSSRKNAKAFGLRAKHEVILSGGAFNTPQLLMLSGIGDKRELERHSIATRVNLPGVGRNLQDRYEFGVVAKFKNNTSSLANCTFDPKNDPCLDEYLETDDRSSHLYSSNGVLVGHIKKSKSAKKESAADLFVFATPGDFRGYSPNWSKKATANSDRLTWAVLKGHTRNTEGYVKLKSKNPHERPEINFMNFAQGRESDLDALMEGVELAHKLNGNLMDKGRGVLKEEIWPPKKNPETGLPFTSKELRSFVTQESWGHHASCTCKMGPTPEKGDVVNSKFQVHGVDGLRIVDASVFPNIPGLFIAAPIYTIAEKAADELTKKYKK